MNSIYSVGSINWDRYLIPNQLPQFYLGGSACNTAHFLSQLLPPELFRIYLVGLIGNDEAGKQVQTQLAKKKFSSKYVEIRSGNTGSTDICLDDLCERTISRMQSVTAKLPDYLETEQIKKRLKDQIIHTKGGKKVIESLFKMNSNIYSCDISGFLGGTPEDLADWIKNTFQNKTIRILFGNAEEFSELIRALNPEKKNSDLTEKIDSMDADLIRACCDIFRAEIACLKQGKFGATAITEEEVYFIHAKKITPVDTTGAGDAFNAGFLASYFQEKDILQALTQGVHLGTLNCGAIGAQELGFDPTSKEWKKNA
jgi:sugar/nucleoside kinase (ribokinase family)